MHELQRARVGVVVAGAGYGKTILGAELSRSLGEASVNALLGPADGEPSALVARLISALKRSRLAELAAAVNAERGDPAAAIDALAAALAREPAPVVLVIDDVHHASAGAGELLSRLGAVLPGGHRLLILARHLPARLEAMAQRGVAIGSEQLAFTREEAIELFAGGFDVHLTEDDARELVGATAGWAAALVLAASTVARAERPDATLREIIERRSPLQYLIDRLLGELDAQRQAAVVQLAHLPLLSDEVAAAAAGEEQLLERAGAAGLPLSVRADGWWEFPGPVQEEIARRRPLEPATALAVAPVYVQRGELADAIRLLLLTGHADGAAELLAGISPQEADELGYLELSTLNDSLPVDAVERHPGALLHLARACEPAAQVRLRARTLERIRELALLAEDGRLLAAADAEIARDLVRDGRPTEAVALASELLTRLGGEELTTRVRVLDVLGRAAAWRRDPDSLAEAERLLREAHTLCLRLGQRRWASQVVMPLAHGVFFARGDHEAAIELIERTLDELPGRSRNRGVILGFYADILVDCGRYTDAAGAIDEGRRLGEMLDDHRIAAYAAWPAARMASQLGDRERTLREVRAVEAQRDDWFAHSTGLDFLADAADLLDRVGETELALDYLERARERREEAPHMVALAEAAVLARSGDPEEADRACQLLEEIPRLERRERWRGPLLRAFAALRRGDSAAGRLAALAFERASELGKPELPLIRDRAVAERVIGLAAVSGSLAAARLEGAGRPLTLGLLGRFELRRGGDLVQLPAGRPAQLVKLLAVSGGRLPTEQAIEELWPDLDPQRGRKGMRNVLNRLHAVVPDVVIREGEMLALGDVEVDAELFEAHARRVLDHPESASARLALAHYRGLLLPEDQYEPWAAAPRERLERLFIALLDRAAAGAESAGEVDEALRLIDRALELEPYDEQRYLRGARLLLAQGRRGAAMALLERSAAALQQLGVPPSPAHSQLVAAARS